MADGNGKLVLVGDSVSRINRIQTQIENLTRWQEAQLRRTIEQYDKILERPGVTPDALLRIVEAKTRALSRLGDNSSRVSLALERERREAERNQYKLLQRQKLALSVSRSAAKGVVRPHEVPDFRPPRVRMFAIGCEFKATVGLGALERKPPANWYPDDESHIPD